MDIVYAHQIGIGNGIFLAGPSPRGKTDLNWRPLALRLLDAFGYEGEAYVPLPHDGQWLDAYESQIDWEVEYLNKAAVIAFWMPRNISYMPGFTSNVEFGEFLHSGKMILGYPPKAHKMKYLQYRADKIGIPTFETLDGTMAAAFVQQRQLTRFA